ncbi:MAG: GNAT family N-acetyltransferase [Lachnospiraceae bacterium]|jgi:RimJ/RimL family protein N-acetyltransferase|nr:GNAT family N-acetyltransferase [Lachnospiraceae bacterium]
MNLRGLVISLKEFNIAKEKDPERFVMEDGLTELLDSLYRYGVQIINLDMFEADSRKKLETVLEFYRIRPEECLVLAATDRVLSISGDLACIGYVNPGIPRQKLSEARMIVEGFDEVDFSFLERIYQRKHGIPWTVIETERCILREITLEDLDALYELYQGESITRYMEGLYENRQKEEEYTRAYIENMYTFFGYGMWVAVEKSSGTIIGRAGLDHLQLQGETIVELGYVIGEQFQNQGYATELCESILKFAKESLECPKLYCLIHKENRISVHLAEKLGFIWQEEIKIRQKPLQKYMKPLYNVD